MVAGLWFRSYIHPEYFPFFEGENQMFLFQLVNGLLVRSALLNNLLAMVFVVVLSFLVLRLNTNFAFIRVRTFLPSNIFILIVSGMLALHTFHPVYFGLLFLMFSTERIFISYEIEKFHGGAFETGLFIGVGSLFYFNLIFFFPIIWIGLLLIRKRPEWRNYVLPVLGVFVPWLFAWSYYFLTDQLNVFFETISVNFATDNNLLRENIPLQFYLGFLVLLTLLGSIFLLGQYDEKKISTRKYFQVFFLIFVIAFALLIVVPAVSQEILVLMALPLTFLISNYLIYMKRQFWSNLIMYLFVALVIYLQFA
jgi:hypothetical protein